MSEPSIHASAVVIGEAGVLIRGSSGAGKSALATALVREAGIRGLFGRLLGDDRILLTVAGGRLAARPHPRIAGLMETRGVGLVAMENEPAVILRLVADLGETADRMPEAADLSASVEGVILPRLMFPVRGAAQDQATLIVDRLQRDVG